MEKNFFENRIFLFNFIFYYSKFGIGDWGLGIGDWGLGIGPNPQSPIPNPQSPIPIELILIFEFKNIFINKNE